MTYFTVYFLLQARERSNDFTGGIIFFLIWGAIAVLSQYGKWKEKKRREQAETATAPPLMVVNQRLGAMQPQANRLQPARLSQRPLPKRGVMRQLPKRQQQPPRRPTIAPAVLKFETKRAPATIAREAATGHMAHEIGSVAEKTRFKPGVSASELRQTARPMSLRKHLLVMELLLPPMGLRNEHEHT